ncbi:MAG: hypothetical protein EOO38_20760 [Cytophagaceae bacterium]|nr:MAG: hypothetical protein EOO38_20760 [Cytophagaceae bacterium]
MLNALIIIVGCIALPVFLLVFGPKVIVYAYLKGVPESVLALLLGGLPIVLLLYFMRRYYNRADDKPSTSPVSQYFRDISSATAVARNHKKVPKVLYVFIFGTLSVQWVFLNYQISPYNFLKIFAICTVIGVTGMSPVSIWNLRRTAQDGSANRLVMPKMPWQVIIMCAAGLLLFLNDAFEKHRFFAITVALLIFNVSLMRLFMIMVQMFKHRAR